MYLGGLLGESDAYGGLRLRKNLAQIAGNSVDGSYNSLRHFLNNAPWDVSALNNRRLEVMQQCRQTKLQQGFTLIIDDSGHRKSGNATAGVGRQYIGEIGKTDNGVVLLTTYFYDGVRKLPLDVALYQHGNSLPQGKADPKFVKKPDLALQLIDQCLKRGYRPKTTLIDAGYGNNTPFVKQLESRNLTYIAAIAKNRKFTYQLPTDPEPRKYSVEEIAQALPAEYFKKVQLDLQVPRTVWVALVQVHIPKLEGLRTVAIQLNASTWSQATEVDYFLSNAPTQQVSPTWVASTYSQRNWVEVFYREALMMVRITRISGARCQKSQAALDFGVYSLHIYPLASINWRISPPVGN